MKAILFVNGVYSCYTKYKKWIENADCIMCADGGANYAYTWQVQADYLVGDLDSVRPEVLEWHKKQNTEIVPFSPIKDETDTQIALRMLVEQGADEIILLGSMGGRPDHSFSNLLSVLPFVREGVRVCHVDTECLIWITKDELEIKGNPGDLVSIFSLTEKSNGISIEGFQYPLHEADLYWDHPYAVSNVLLGDRGTIVIRKGIIAVMHFQSMGEGARNSEC